MTLLQGRLVGIGRVVQGRLVGIGRVLQGRLVGIGRVVSVSTSAGRVQRAVASYSTMAACVYKGFQRRPV